MGEFSMIKQFMKRLASYALIGAMLLLPTGCGSSKEKPSEAKTQEVTQAPVTQAAENSDEPKSDKTYEFTWTAWQASPLDEDPYILENINKKYNVKINIWNIDPSKFDEILSMSLASGEVPDLIRTSNYSKLSNYFNQDILMELNEEKIAKYAPNLYKEYTSFDKEFFKKNGRVDDKLLAINQLNVPPARKAVVYRGDWMKNVGVTKAPETLKEFEELMYKFAKEDPDMNGKNDTYGLSNTGMQVVFGAYGYMPMQLSDIKPKPHVWVERDGKLVYSSVQPEMKEALALLSKWYKDGVIDPEFITGEVQGAMQSLPFIKGRLGFTADSAWHYWIPPTPGRKEVAKGYSEINKLNPEAAENLIVASPPAGPNGQRGQYCDDPVGTLMYAFSKDMEKEPDKLAKLLQVIDGICFTSYEDIMTAWFGIKDQDWKLNEFGIASSTLEKWTSTGAAKEGGHTQLVILKSEKNKKPEAVDKWIKSSGFYDFAMFNKLNKVQPSANQYLVELDKMEAEAYYRIITGEKPIDYFDEFVQKWYSSGGDILTKEAN